MPTTLIHILRRNISFSRKVKYINKVISKKKKPIQNIVKSKLIHYAVRTNQKRMLKYLITKLNIDVNSESIDRLKTTPFNTAASCSNLSILKELVNYNADVNRFDADGDNSLHLAAMFNTSDVVEYLIVECNIPVNIKSTNKFQYTPFHHAICYGNGSAMKKLLELGADHLTPLPNGDTAIHLATFYNRVHPLTYLIKHLKHNIDLPHKKGLTPFLLAAKEDHVEVLDVLLKSGADSNMVSNPYGNHAIHLAAMNNSVKTLQYLVETIKSDVNLKQSNGYTPIHIATKFGNLNAMKKLNELGADLKLPNKNGAFLIHTAARHHNPAIIEFIIKLLKFPIDMREKNFRGKTPFLISIESKNLAVVKKLKECGADDTISDLSGNYPIHIAAKAGDVSILRYLMDELSADMNLPTKSNNTYLKSKPLYIAAINGKTAAVKELLRRKVDLGTCEEQKEIAEHLVINDQIPIIVVLSEINSNFRQAALNKAIKGNVLNIALSIYHESMFNHMIQFVRFDHHGGTLKYNVLSCLFSTRDGYTILQNFLEIYENLIRTANLPMFESIKKVAPIFHEFMTSKNVMFSEIVLIEKVARKIQMLRQIQKKFIISRLPNDLFDLMFNFLSKKAEILHTKPSDIRRALNDSKTPSDEKFDPFYSSQRITFFKKLQLKHISIPTSSKKRKLS